MDALTTVLDLYNNGYRVKLLSDRLSISFHDCKGDTHSGTINVNLYENEELLNKLSDSLGNTCTCMKIGPPQYKEVDIRSEDTVVIRSE